MAYEVEFTAEFESWWNSLDEDEQESVDFSVRLLEERGIHHPMRMRSMGRSLPTCANSAVSTKAGRTECSMRSIRGVRRFCLSAETRPGGQIGMRNLFRRPTGYTSVISARSNKKQSIAGISRGGRINGPQF